MFISKIIIIVFCKAVQNSLKLSEVMLATPSTAGYQCMKDQKKMSNYRLAN